MILRWLLLLAIPLLAQSPSFDYRKAIVDLGARFENAKEYSFEADLQLVGQRGTQPGRELARGKVKLAVAPDGKYLLHLTPVDKDEYMLISNGQKSWAYVPKLKQYTEQEEAAVTGEDDEDGPSGSDERDLAESFARQVMPTLARLAKTAYAADVNGVVEVKYEGKKQRWPVLRVQSRRDDREGQNLTQLAVNPETLDIGRMIWSNVSTSNGEKFVIQMTLNFETFRTGSLPESTFTFTPTNKIKLVESLPIPGQTGSFLLNQPAPDFELKTLDGDKVRLSELRKPVLLSFWASWCGPCRRELPRLEKLNAEYKSKGLVILGVNDEEKSTARKFLAKEGLSIPTLDDAARKVHRLYRVRSIPSVFLIDASGKVVKFFKGAREEAELRAALKSVGL